MSTDQDWRIPEGGHRKLAWDARCRRVVRELHLDLGWGEPGDALKVRIETLEELVQKLRREGIRL